MYTLLLISNEFVEKKMLLYFNDKMANIEHCYQLAVIGEKNDGDGVVIYRNSDATYDYLPLNKVKPQELKEKLSDLLEEDKSYYYGMIEENSMVHIFKIPKPIIN